MAESLAEIEERYGFVFGTPSDVENDGARIVKHIKCQTVGCSRAAPQSPAQPIHEDTVSPVICGECTQILFCDHRPGDAEDRVAGSLSDPYVETVRSCRLCGVEVDRQTTKLQPVKIDELPAAALAALGVPFVPHVGQE